MSCTLWLTVVLACLWPVAVTSLVHPARDTPVHEARTALPPGFINTGPAAADSTLNLRFALAQENPDDIVNALYTVSDPKSAMYGQYLSKAEVDNLVAPKADALDAVNSWLKTHGFEATPLSPSGDWVAFRTSVGEANKLFNANYSIFTHDATGVQVTRTMAYSLPDDLVGYVDLVHPTTSFPNPDISGAHVAVKRAAPMLAKRNFTFPSNCSDDETVPACLQMLYNIPLTPATNPKNRLGVTGKWSQSAHYASLKTFLMTFRPDMDPNTNFTLDSVDGGTNDQDGPSADEGDLDIQYTVGLATDVPVVLVFIGLNTTDGDFDGFLDEANHLLAEEHPPQVLTTSYGFTESALSFALTDKLCRQYAQLGARGTSILYASGDSSVGCPVGNDTSFQATFPSNCPFVTSVGGTQSFSPEVAWVRSSGGFSNYYPRPQYQDAAVKEYLAQLGSTNAGKFNASGRAFPDIAAKADGYIINSDGFTGVTGTSASSPTVASVIALLNDRLASAGRPPLGFLNPWLYSDGRLGFTDITGGNSSIPCDDPDENRGFAAAEGWDPATGLGTPDFSKLLKVLGLPEN
ncbi:subtilisin-like protein [Trametes sanguinea]|nr:subtilisin-like protein [Trametes sanguinea]